MKKRSGFTVMARLIRLVKSLSGYMVLAILMGLVGHLCAAFITIFGGFAVLDLLGFATPVALKTTFVCVLLFALVRGIFRCAEQSCNHFIAFKLLALIRDKVFRALRRLCPAKLEGRDRLSGTDVSSINTGNLREMESFVTQETHLFHDSIKNNLRIAKLDATDDEIVAACKKAAVHEFIMTLPQGYDTPVGELGDTLSGGERQRLGLARAFLHDAPLMLLDEPTSNLDSLNEAVILKSLHEQCAGKTVVLVSHRASTMRIADTVYSVEHGRMS